MAEEPETHIDINEKGELVAYAQNEIIQSQSLQHQYSFEDQMIINRELEINFLWKRIKGRKREQKADLKRYQELCKLSQAHARDPLEDSD